RLLRDYGTMPLDEILGPAIGYAENGYPAVHQIGMTVAAVAELFRREWPSSAAIYLPTGAPPEPGRLFRNPDIGAPYRRVRPQAGSAAAIGTAARVRSRRSRPARRRFCPYRRRMRQARLCRSRGLVRRP